MSTSPPDELQDGHGTLWKTQDRADDSSTSDEWSGRSGNAYLSAKGDSGWSRYADDSSADELSVKGGTMYQHDAESQHCWQTDDLSVKGGTMYQPDADFLSSVGEMEIGAVGWGKLERKVIAHILTMLPPMSAGAAGCVCRAWRGGSPTLS